MDFKKIIEDYNELNKQCNDCKNTKKESIKGLTKEIDALLKNRSLEEYSQYFSELFDMWNKVTNIVINTNTKSSEYIPASSTSMLQKVKSVQEDSTTPTEEENLQGKLMIEFLLRKIWLYIFNENLIFSHLESFNTNTKQTYSHKNWALYELINQISKTIHKMIQEGDSKKIKISTLSKHRKNELLENTDEICKYILDTYILGNDQNKKNSKNWFPKLETKKEIQLSDILATSDLIGYIFEYKLMETKRKNQYLQEVDTTIKKLYNKLTDNHSLYSAIEVYLNEDNEDIVVKYKNHLLSPRTIFIMIMSIIQEIVKKALTEPYKNIFYTISGAKITARDHGLTEKAIMTQINKDIKSYKLIYHYFDNTGKQTTKKKLEKLDQWANDLNKFEYGIFDNYLYDLAIASNISFEDTTVTTVKLSKKLNF